jgi:hypothetical protein
MELVLYQNLSDPNEYPKNLTTIDTLNVLLLEESSIINPKFQVSNPNFTANYCYVPDFNRYYYITNITVDKNRLFVINAKCDVLQSFFNEIKESPVIIKRSSKLDVLNSYIKDANREFYPYNYNEYIVFGSLGKPLSPVLVTIG